MNREHTLVPMLRHGLLAALAAALLPGAALAADSGRSADDIARDARRQQEEARRQMAERERTQREALRGQQEAIRRMEETRARLEASTREVAELSRDLGRNSVFTFGSIGAPPRALLGLSVRSDEGRTGAVVEHVSPGGAAAEAGIRAGDVITSLDGLDLTKDGNPARALVERMGQVQPNEKLKVELLRDGNRMSFEVTPRLGPGPSPFVTETDPRRLEQLRAQLEQLRLRYTDQHPDVRRLAEQVGESLPQSFTVFGASPLSGMEFATLSERLGGYFGVQKGVLVVRAGADAPFGLQDGDVILAIDGREPANAQHVGRILRSYQPGEKVKLRVQRDRRAIDIDTSAPGRTGPGQATPPQRGN